MSVPGWEGAVYTPLGVICPKLAFQLTVFVVVLPDTVAENWSVAPVVDDEEPGVMVTDVTDEPGCPVDGAFTGGVGFVAVVDFAAVPAHPNKPNDRPTMAKAFRQKNAK
jgi:hypothetical protein